MEINKGSDEKTVTYRNGALKNYSKSNASKKNGGAAAEVHRYKQNKSNADSESFGHLTDKQAAATFKTNDFLSDDEGDPENEIESFILEQKILSSGYGNPISPKNHSFTPEKSK